jgi:hypothetical protein
MRELQPGDWVRAKVHTICGWRGTGTVVGVDPDYSGVVVEKDDAPGDTAEFFPDELVWLGDGFSPPGGQPVY